MKQVDGNSNDGQGPKSKARKEYSQQERDRSCAVSWAPDPEPGRS